MNTRLRFSRKCQVFLFTVCGLLSLCAGQGLAEIGTDGSIVVVMNKAELQKNLGDGFASVLQACQTLVGQGAEHILDAGEAYQQGFGKPILVDKYPAKDSDEKALWLRTWLAQRIRPGGTIVFLGNENALPTWQLQTSSFSFIADSLYEDLNADGIPDTSVARVVGTSEMMVRQLLGRQAYGRNAVILCSEDTRIHYETRVFAKNLSQLGYEVAVRASRDDKAISDSDVIIHFGHGDSRFIGNRFNKPFAVAGSIPPLKRAPIVFVEGGGTISPVDSPLLYSFLRQGAVGYFGSTGPVLGQTPARLAGEMMEHLLRVHIENPDLSLPQLLRQARAAYIHGHTDIQEVLRRLAIGDTSKLTSENFPDVVSILEWAYYGDPRAAMQKVGPPNSLTQEVFSLKESISLTDTTRSWETSYLARADQGQVVLALYADIPRSQMNNVVLSVRHNNEDIVSLDAESLTKYKDIGKDCRGGYVCGEMYRARFLIPLSEGKQGEHKIGVHLVEGTSAVLTLGTMVDIWPANFEDQMKTSTETDAAKKGTVVPKFIIPEKSAKIPQNMQGCAENLVKIRQALGEYRKQKGRVPDWLSDLVPDFLGSEALLCPNDVLRKPPYLPDDVSRNMPYFQDPCLPCSYTYEYCSAPVKPDSPVTCRQWKAMQVKQFGTVAPMVRCLHHGEGCLNLSLDGRLYLSPLRWELLFLSYLRAPPTKGEP